MRFPLARTLRLLTSCRLPPLRVHDVRPSGRSTQTVRDRDPGRHLRIPTRLTTPMITMPRTARAGGDALTLTAQPRRETPGTSTCPTRQTGTARGG